MPPLIIYTLLIFLALFILITLIDLIRNRSLRRLIGHAAIFIGLAFILYITTGFPFYQYRQAFGGGWSPESGIFIMFALIGFQGLLRRVAQ